MAKKQGKKDKRELVADDERNDVEMSQEGEDEHSADEIFGYENWNSVDETELTRVFCICLKCVFKTLIFEKRITKDVFSLGYWNGASHIRVLTTLQKVILEFVTIINNTVQ
jgi:hypothetical protein